MHNSGGRARQIYECEASLIYRASSRTTWVTWRNPVIKNKKKKEQVEEKKVVQPKQKPETLVAAAKSQASSDSRDVDEYNRRYTSVEVEEPYREDDSVLYEDSGENGSSSERRSDTEYTERIIRYHSPSKITIAGADQVDLYLSDGYYAYGYDTDYSNGNANVNFNINIGNGWGSPWYTGWYDPWFYSYSPWWTYSPRFYGPSWGFGWGWGGFYVVRSMVWPILGLGWRLLGWPLGTSPSLLSRLLLDSK